MKKYIAGVWLIVMLSNASVRAQHTFIISGSVTGMENKTMLYLKDASKGTLITLDSTLVINKTFTFKGGFEEDVKQVLIGTKNLSDYVFFRLENKKITFSAEKGKFKKAVITGSKTQQEDEELTAYTATRKGPKAYAAFIRTHPNSIISANILNVYASTWGKDATAAMYSLLSDKMKKTAYGSNVSDFITLNKNVKVGDKFADFTQANTAGKNVSLSDFAGKVVLLEFWGSWCGPCRKNNPDLVATYNEFKNRGFEILGVAADDIKENWLEAVKEDKLPWENVSDLRGDRNKAALIYGISYYPANFLIDKTGTIVARDLRGADLKKKLREILP